MVSVEYFDDAERRAYVGQIVLQPNNSMTWQATRYFLLTLMLISFTMATLFLWQGYWMILPFSVLEMSILFLLHRSTQSDAGGGALRRG